MKSEKITLLFSLRGTGLMVTLEGQKLPTGEIRIPPKESAIFLDTLCRCYKDKCAEILISEGVVDEFSVYVEEPEFENGDLSDVYDALRCETDIDGISRVSGLPKDVVEECLKKLVKAGFVYEEHGKYYRI